LGVLNWSIAENTQIATTFDDLFTFD